MRAFATGLTFFAKRAPQAILVMIAIAMIAFAVKGALGDPLREIMGEAVTRADVPLITTYLVAVGFLFVVTNTLADIVSLWLDPRISLEARQ